MAKAVIDPGVCGLKTTVIARKNGDGTIHLDIQSDCAAVRKLGERLQNVDPYREFTFRRKLPEVWENSPECLSHPACPVPSGIIKAIEVAAGLALPRDVNIQVSKDDE